MSLQYRISAVSKSESEARELNDDDGACAAAICMERLWLPEDAGGR